ncbi:hypothetical protein B0J17DRAFT_719338 [Rhizoctonia solani]|nr:hypothetical protein B0J17DRAFT_719338 [Rhizoctonia solani]
MSTPQVDTRTDEEKKKLLKLLRTRGQIPLIPESEGHHVPPLSNVQGDVLFRFPKSYEYFIFFRINTDRVNRFKDALKTFQVTSAQDVKNTILEICIAKDEAGLHSKHRRIPVKQQLIAFSRAGLNALGIQEGTGDERFDKYCMMDNKTELGDQSNWHEPFAKVTNNCGKSVDAKSDNPIHGVVVIAGDPGDSCLDWDSLDAVTQDLRKHFGETWDIPSARVKKQDWEKSELSQILVGTVRKGEHRHEEHFGFQDGISQPAIRDIEHPLPGQTQVDAGVIVMGYPGDPVPKSQRPAWTKDGTMMVFRKLEQSVCLFNKYVEANGCRWKEFFPGGEEAAKKHGFNEKDGPELFAARFVGRWKSGAPLALAPFKDDPQLGQDPKRNNDFDYTVTGVPGVSPREPSDHYCPFTAHARKTAPRNLDPYLSRKYLESSSIVRAAIPYGCELTDEEKQKKEDLEERGLLFVCYASHLDSGFVRQTTGFGNNDFFPVTSLKPTKHGQDPIIGGPPAAGSSERLREVIEISCPIDRPDPFKKPEPIATITEKTYKVSEGDQVNLQLNVKDDHGCVVKKFEVSGFVKEKPLDKPDPGDDNPFFVTSRGGEYFFVPSISTLRSWANH